MGKAVNNQVLGGFFQSNFIHHSFIGRYLIFFLKCGAPSIVIFRFEQWIKPYSFGN